MATCPLTFLQHWLAPPKKCRAWDPACRFRQGRPHLPPKKTNANVMLQLQLPTWDWSTRGVILTRISVRCTVTGRQERHKGGSIRKQTQSSPQLLPCYTNSFTSEVEGHTVRILDKRGVSTEGQSSRGVLTSKHFFQTLSAYTNNKLERGQEGTRDTREDWPTVGHAHVTRDRAQNGGR